MALTASSVLVPATVAVFYSRTSLSTFLKSSEVSWDFTQIRVSSKRLVIIHKHIKKTLYIWQWNIYVCVYICIWQWKTFQKKRMENKWMWEHKIQPSDNMQVKSRFWLWHCQKKITKLNVVQTDFNFNLPFRMKHFIISLTH